MTSFKTCCACSAVKFSFTPTKGVSACHCSTCQAWTGGIQLAVPGGKDPTLDDPQQQLKVWKSSPWAERGFCATCGSSIYYKLTGDGPQQGEYFFNAGGLEDWKDLVIDQQIFIDCKPAAFTLETKNEHKQMTKAEVMASFGASS